MSSLNLISPTHKLTEGRAPAWGPEFTTRVAHYRGDSAETAARIERNFWDLVRGVALPSVTAEYDFEQPSEKKLCVGG